MAQEALTQKVESFVKEQWADARAQLRLVESEAGKVATRDEKEARRAVKSFKTRARKGQKEVRGILKSASLEASKEKLTAWLRITSQTASSLRANWIRAAGFASADDLSLLAREVSKIGKKLDALAKPKKHGA
jgi:hypothetical protein